MHPTSNAASTARLPLRSFIALAAVVAACAAPGSRAASEDTSALTAAQQLLSQAPMAVPIGGAHVAEGPHRANEQVR